jgi:succinoglycan biosynthesis transport protein ExoP
MEDVIHRGFDARQIARRRLPIGVVTMLLLIAITTGLALGLPSYFKSKAVILIEAQEMPQDLVRSLVTSFADERIQVISQRVLTNTNLTSIIEKYNLYSDERKNTPLEGVLEKMKKGITITPISADVVDPKAGRSVQATIAFELSYESKSPELAQRVANEIVSLFLSENLRQRSETSTETLKFLTEESEKLRTQVSELEQNLADFKAKNVERLPELNNLNIEMMNRTDDDIRSLETQIRSLQQQQVYLESELGQQKPVMGTFAETGERILGPVDRLKVLESQFAPLASRYGPNHPDVVAKRKEIEGLKAQVGESSSTQELELRLKEAQSNLAALQKKYSNDHPDVKALNREVAALRNQVESDRNGRKATLSGVERPDNPAYIELSARLQGTLNDLRGLETQKASLRAKRAALENRITGAPEVERIYRGLSRDYETAQLKYQEIVAKKQEAEVASNLESQQKGERFTLIEPPVTPESPSKPNRLAIAVLGGLFSIVAGVGLALAAENMDDRIYGRAGVASFLGVAPLAVIPEIENRSSRWAGRRKKFLATIAMLVAVIGLLFFVHFAYRPLDVLFFQIIRRISN